MTLSVRDLERLAKAGVRIDLTERMLQEVQADFEDARQPPSTQYRQYPMVDAFWERWRRNKVARHPDYHEMLLSSQEVFNFHAIEVGDKVHCMVSDRSRLVMIEDDPGLFPSDSLIASILLWEKTK